MKKKLEAYSETLFHLINFRTEQFQQSKAMIGIDYDSFMILNVMASHYIKNNTKMGKNWDDVWESIRKSKINLIKNKLNKLKRCVVFLSPAL